MFRTHCPQRGSHLPNQMRKRSSYDPQHRSCGLYRLRNLHQDMPTGCFQARTRARGPFPLHGGLPSRGRHSRQPLPDPAGAPWRSGPALPQRPAVSGHHGPGMFPSLREKVRPEPCGRGGKHQCRRADHGRLGYEGSSRKARPKAHHKDRGNRFRPGGAFLRVVPRTDGVPGDGFRGDAASRRHVAVRHPRVSASRRDRCGPHRPA